MSRDIIQQGDWGYGDTAGLAKAVDKGYKKFLKKYGLEPEGPKSRRGRPKSLSYGNKTKS
jgi:hypothetical protein